MLDVVIIYFHFKRCLKETFSLRLEDKVCRKCQVGTNCAGGAEIFLKPGYWRRSNLSEIIIECENR